MNSIDHRLLVTKVIHALRATRPTEESMPDDAVRKVLKAQHEGDVLAVVNALVELGAVDHLTAGLAEYVGKAEFPPMPRRSA
jgi:hypothetical protein